MTRPDWRHVLDFEALTRGWRRPRPRIERIDLVLWDYESYRLADPPEHPFTALTDRPDLSKTAPQTDTRIVSEVAA